MFQHFNVAAVIPATTAGFLMVQQGQPQSWGYQHINFGSMESASPSSSEAGTVPIRINGTTYFQTPASLESDSGKDFKALWTLSAHDLVSDGFTASEEELRDNGYPMFEDGQDKVANIKETWFTREKNMYHSPEEGMRRCCRCQRQFELKKNGSPCQGECMYHPKGKDRETNLRLCCQEVYGATEGCQLRNMHVFDQLSTEELENFVQAERPYGRSDMRSEQILAIDAEMVYTIAGPALARLSVVNWNGKLVLDCKVKPPTAVIDPNTEFSGLTIEDIQTATETLESARQKLLCMVNQKTILVGHSLESDLKALRLVHYNVADTSLLFKEGSRKVGLKKLASELLGLQIQSNNPHMHGHDSEEDARVALQLLKWRMENID